MNKHTLRAIVFSVLVLAVLAAVMLITSARRGTGEQGETGRGATAEPTAAAAAPTPGQMTTEAPVTPTPTATAAPTATPTASPTASPSPTPSPAPSPSPTPTPEYLSKYPNKNQNLKVTKDPEGVQVQAGASAVFTAEGANYAWCAWRFVSPEGKELIFDVANTKFPGIWTNGGNALTFTVNNIPETMDGWKAVCLFSDGAGNYALSREALIKVSKAATTQTTTARTVTNRATPTPAPAAAATPTPAPATPTPEPVVTPVPVENETPIF